MMGLEYPTGARFAKDGEFGHIEEDCRSDFMSLIVRTATSAEKRQEGIELFKRAFCDVLDDKEYTRSTSSSWAHSDLADLMEAASGNQVHFLDALWTGFQLAAKRGWDTPSLDRLNEVCRRHDLLFEFDPPQIVSRPAAEGSNETGGEGPNNWSEEHDIALDEIATFLEELGSAEPSGTVHSVWPAEANKSEHLVLSDAVLVRERVERLLEREAVAKLHQRVHESIDGHETTGGGGLLSLLVRLVLARQHQLIQSTETAMTECRRSIEEIWEGRAPCASYTVFDGTLALSKSYELSERDVLLPMTRELAGYLNSLQDQRPEIPSMRRVDTFRIGQPVLSMNILKPAAYWKFEVEENCSPQRMALAMQLAWQQPAVSMVRLTQPQGILGPYGSGRIAPPRTYERRAAASDEQVDELHRVWNILKGITSETWDGGSQGERTKVALSRFSSALQRRGRERILDLVTALEALLEKDRELPFWHCHLAAVGLARSDALRRKIFADLKQAYAVRTKTSIDVEQEEEFVKSMTGYIARLLFAAIRWQDANEENHSFEDELELALVKLRCPKPEDVFDFAPSDRSINSASRPTGLCRIRLGGITSIADGSLEFGPLSVLIGANGAGKSNVLSALKLVSQIWRGTLQLHVGDSGGASALLHYGAKRTKEISLELDFNHFEHRNRYCVRLRFASGERLIFAEESVGYQADTEAKMRMTSLGAGHRESLLPEEKTSDVVVRSVDFWLSQIAFFHFHDTSKNSELRTNARKDDDQTLSPDGGNLAAYLYRLSEGEGADKKAWRRIGLLVQRVAPSVKALAPTLLDNGQHVRLDWIDDRGERFGVHQFSDGTLRAIALITALAQPVDRLPRFICIDEPEIGLHPAAVALVAELGRSVSYRSKILFATQSTAFLDHFELGEVVVVERENGATVLKPAAKLDLAGWLEEYTLSEVFDKGLLGGRP